MILSLAVWAILLVGLVATSEDEETIFNFGVCPESHPFAFESGQQCCSKRTNWFDNGCEGEAINCDSTTCEDHTSCCGNCCPTYRISSCESTEFLKIEKLSPDYDGIYWKSEYLEANRPIFGGKDGRKDKCMWWQHLNRHWWIGECDAIGDNAGFAYIDEDLGCPTECRSDLEAGQDLPCNESTITWRRGGSNEPVEGVIMSTNIFYLGFGAVSGEERSTNTTIAVGENAVIQSGTRYRQDCTFKRINGKFNCVKKNQ